MEKKEVFATASLLFLLIPGLAGKPCVAEERLENPTKVVVATDFASTSSRTGR